MSKKFREPPKAVFKHRLINACQLEKPKAGVNKKWVSELDAIEERVKNYISLDINRLSKICDDPVYLERLCNVLELKLPLEEEAAGEPNYSLHNFPGIKAKKRHTIVRKLMIASNMEVVEEVDDEEEGQSTEVLSDLQDSEYRRTLFQSVLGRASGRREHVSPYKVSWSEETIEKDSVLSPPDFPSPDNQSEETMASLSEDLFVNPAPSQNMEILEPLEDARSPYQKFFSRTNKEIREHVERLRKKKFHSNSEKAIGEFVQFLEQKNLRSPKVTVETLNKLFMVEVQTPVEQSFTLDPKELPSVPKEIADLFQDPQSSTRAVLHQQIIWDMLYEKGKGRKLAFGRALPKERRPWFKNTMERWFLPPGISWDLISGQDLWKNLLHTEILEDFGKWLLNNPDYPRPEYLVRIGFFKDLEEKMEKETENVAVSVKDEKQFLKILRTLSQPLRLDADEENFKKLPKYAELKEAALHRVLTQEGLDEFH